MKESGSIYTSINCEGSGFEVVPNDMEDVPIIKPKPQQGPIFNHKIVYYSDFDLSIEDWKMEYASMQIYTKTLREVLGNVCESL